MKLELMTMGAVAALAVNSFGASIKAYNYQQHTSNFVLDGLSGNLLVQGSLALGTFNTDPSGGAVIEPGRVREILAGFTLFAQGTPSFAANGASGIYEMDFEVAIPPESPLVGKNMFTVIGNKPTLSDSTQILVYKHPQVFKSDPESTGNAFLNEHDGGQLLVGTFGRLGFSAGSVNPSFSLAVEMHKPPPLLAYFDFNDAEDPDKTTDSVAGHVGHLAKGAIRTANGGGRSKASGDYAMDFGKTSDGQYVNVADANFLNAAALYDVMTISFWQKLDSVAKTSSFWGYAPSSNGYRGIQASVTWNDGVVYFDSAGCCEKPTQRLSGPPIGVNLKEWTHCVFIKNGSNKQVWLNGKRILSRNGASPLPTDFSRLFIGSQIDGNASLQGDIDDFAIYSVALTEEQINKLATGTSPDHLLGNPFQITIVGQHGNGLALFWRSQVGKSYAIEASAALKTWNEIRSNIVSTGKTTSALVPVDPGIRHRFYRVVERKRPIIVPLP